MDAPIQQNTPAAKKTKKLFKWVLLLLLLILLGIASFYAYQVTYKNDEGLYKDVDAQLGLLPDMTEEEIQQRLNTVISEGMMNVSINPHPVFTDGESSGNLRIENIEQNHYSYIVTIVRDDTGEEIYKSGLLQPGYYIENAKLEIALPKGEYAATAHFLAYENPEEKAIGAAVVKIAITVEK